MFRKFKLKSFASLKMVSRKVQNEFKIWRVYLQARSPPRRGISNNRWASLWRTSSYYRDLSRPVTRFLYLYLYLTFVFVFLMQIQMRVSDYHNGPRTTTHRQYAHLSPPVMLPENQSHCKCIKESRGQNWCKICNWDQLEEITGHIFSVTKSKSAIC